MVMPSLIHHLDDKINSGASNNVLSFEQHKPQLIIPHQDEYSMWDQENLMSSTDDHCRSSSRLFDDFSSQQGAFAWLYSDGAILAPVCVHDHTTLPQKRPHLGESTNTQATKKQCTTKNKQKQSGSSSIASKDPQSIAAKNRRERISDRLKILQELIPNGCKVDLVTMLEKAISYVKFLQLQVKVLATDEFWPEQGGKAPDISQVKEAIDAILSSQIRETQAHPLCHEATTLGIY